MSGPSTYPRELRERAVRMVVAIKVEYPIPHRLPIFCGMKAIVEIQLIPCHLSSEGDELIADGTV